MNIVIREDGTWCRIYHGEPRPKGDRVEVPNDYVTDDDVDTFVVNWLEMTPSERLDKAILMVLQVKEWVDGDDRLDYGRYKTCIAERITELQNAYTATK